MLGIQTTEEELNIKVYDDKWLPYTEGHPNTEIRFVNDPDNNNLYIGIVIASWDKYDGYVYKEYIPNIEDSLLVTNFLSKTLGNYESAKLMFFVITN